MVKSADETGSDQEARNDDAYALFGRLSSTRIPNKKERKKDGNSSNSPAAKLPRPPPSYLSPGEGFEGHLLLV